MIRLLFADLLTQYHMSILLKFVSNKNVERSDEGSEFNIFIGQKFQQNTNVMLPLFEIQHLLDSIPNPQ